MNNYITKLQWHEIRDHVALIEPKFADLVDQLSPGSEFPLYLVDYHYGETIGDHHGTFLKHESGRRYQLGDCDTPREIMDELGYGMHNSPLLLLMEKKFEWHVFDSSNQNTFPIYVEKPGFFVGTRQLYDTQENNTTYLSSAIMSCTAGSCSSFLLPNIGNKRNHSTMQIKLGITNAPPKDMNAHAAVFREIAGAHCSQHWLAKVLYFSEAWVQALRNDPEWIYLLRYLTEKMLLGWRHDKNKFFYDYAFTKAQILQNIPHNAYLLETAKHIMGIAMGANLGFQPADDAEALPLNCIQQAYLDIYQLKQTPTILEPAKFNIADPEQKPLYYSLQRPILSSLERQSKTEPRALVNLHTLARIIHKFQEAFSSHNDHEDYRNTCIQRMADQIQFDYFHHLADAEDNYTRNSSALKEVDPRYNRIKDRECLLEFPSDARFFRGCVQIGFPQ